MEASPSDRPKENATRTGSGLASALGLCRGSTLYVHVHSSAKSSVVKQQKAMRVSTSKTSPPLLEKSGNGHQHPSSSFCALPA